MPQGFLFCTTYVEKNSNEFCPFRYKKWIDYYSSLKSELGVEHIFLIEDASDREGLEELGAATVISGDEPLPDSLHGQLNIISFNKHLGRSSNKDYGGWWRSFTYSVIIAEKYSFEKIIHIESDFYTTSPRLRNYIKNFNVGWFSLYSLFFAFAETAVQVICKDNFFKLKAFFEEARSNNYRFEEFAELILPITEVNKSFIGDRLGEFQVLRYWLQLLEENWEFDYVGQFPARLKNFSPHDLKKILLKFKTLATGKAEEDIGTFNTILGQIA